MARIDFSINRSTNRVVLDETSVATKKAAITEPTNTFNINKFISHFSANEELAISNKFDVLISIPTALNQYKNLERELILQCESAELPGKVISMIDHRHYGFIERIPHYQGFQEISLSFLLTGNLKIKEFFDIWLDSLVSSDNALVNYVEEDGKKTSADIQIRQYNNSGELSYVYTLIDAYPIVISPVALNWSDDSPMRLNVVFVYRRWISSRTDSIDNGTSEAVIPANSEISQELNRLRNQIISVTPTNSPGLDRAILRSRAAAGVSGRVNRRTGATGFF